MIKVIKDTVTIEKIIKPVYNFKANYIYVYFFKKLVYNKTIEKKGK